MAVAIFYLCPRSDRRPGHGRPLRDALLPLRHVRVWRFGLYYVVVFGAYVALSAWLPKFYIDTYGVSLSTAALLAATFILPASLLRPAGGYLADRWGPRGVTYAVFIVMVVALVFLSVPSLGLLPFAALMFLLGCAMGIGKASVYKYIPDYFPSDVGAVGGVVGMLGALGGFLLPPAFGMLGRWSGIPQLAFLVLLGLTIWSLVWLHIAVIRLRGATLAPRERGATAGFRLWALASGPFEPTCIDRHLPLCGRDRVSSPANVWTATRHRRARISLKPMSRLQTERLLLRPWQAEDRQPFAAMNADPRVMEHFPSTLTRAGNARSIRVMERLKMIRDPLGDFDHPRIPEGHPLRRHVLYRATARTAPNPRTT